MNKDNLFRLAHKPTTWLFASGFLAHGLLLVNDGVYWDGWYLYMAHVQDRFELVRWIFGERGGLPIYTGLLWLLHQSPWFIFTYKLLSFSCIVGSSLAVYWLGKKLDLSVRQSFFVALLAMVFPANRAVVELIITPYLFSYFMYWLAWVAIIKMLEASRRRDRWLLRALALALFVIGMRLYSLLVFHYAFLLIFLLARGGGEIRARIWHSVRFVAGYPELLILPVLFWLVDTMLFPSSGIYVGTNTIRWSLKAAVAFSNYLRFGLFYNLFQSLQFATVEAIAALTLFVMTMVGTRHLSKEEKHNSRRRPGSLLFAGSLLLLAGILPYALNRPGASEATAFNGWTSRHTMLIALPAALLLVAGVQFLGALLKHLVGKKVQTYATRALLFGLVVVFAVSTIGFYLGWQARWVKDRAIVEELSIRHQELKQIEFFYVFDEYPLGGEKRYRPGTFYGLFYLANPDDPKLGVDAYTGGLRNFLFREEKYPGFNDRLFPGVDLMDCQAKLFISKENPYSDTELASRYLFYRFARPENLTSYLRAILSIRVERTTWDEGIHCESFP